MESELTQAWPRPSHPAPDRHHRRRRASSAPRICRPIAAWAFPSPGVFDVNSRRRARRRRTRSASTACSTRSTRRARVGRRVFDLAVPGDQIVGILERLPDGSAVLMQKPMGRDLAERARIRRSAHERELVAAVNFQLRFSPDMLALRDLIERGALGHARRHRRPHRHRSAVAPLDVPRGRAAPRGALPLDPLPRRDPLARRRAATACTAARVAASATAAAARHAQLDHPRLRRSHPLLAGPEPHASRRTALSRVADDGRRARAARRG